MSHKDTSLEEEEGADVDRVEQDGVGREGGVESCCRDLNCASLRFTVVASMAHMKVKGFTVVASMAHMKVKGLNAGKGTEKWRKILAIAEGKMSLSQDAES